MQDIYKKDRLVPRRVTLAYRPQWHQGGTTRSSAAGTTVAANTAVVQHRAVQRLSPVYGFRIERDRSLCHHATPCRCRGAGFESDATGRKDEAHCRVRIGCSVGQVGRHDLSRGARAEGEERERCGRRAETDPARVLSASSSLLPFRAAHGRVASMDGGDGDQAGEGGCEQARLHWRQVGLHMPCHACGSRRGQVVSRQVLETGARENGREEAARQGAHTSL